MVNKEYLKKLKYASLDIKHVAEYVGEDGGMVTDCRTRQGALKRFRKLEEETCGREEALMIKLEDVGIAYLHLASEISEEERDSMEIGDDGWYITPKVQSPLMVWYYSA